MHARTQYLLFYCTHFTINCVNESSTLKQVFFVLSGEIEVIVSKGEKRVFDPRSIVLVEDKEGKEHRSRVVGRAHRVT